jgi:hypothetical protein
VVEGEADLARYRELRDQAIAACPAYPAGRFAGQGIVMAAGGPRYFTCAWVSIKVLRELLGCTLPVEVWYLGPGEMSQQMIDLLTPLGVECVDALARRAPAEGAASDRVPNGWELKPYAIIHSRFKDVMFIDADNVPAIDPSYLLSSPEYAAAGALFWPDIYRLDRGHPIWRIFDVPDPDEPAIESGQLVIDKERCWKALHLALHLNEHSEFYYAYTRGDAVTFYFAWRTLGQRYRMSPHPPVQWTSSNWWPTGLSQRDFAGRVVFQHRTASKWNAWAENPHILEFAYEEDCFRFLRQLRERWDGRVAAVVPVAGSHMEGGNAEEEILQTRRFLYRRAGADERILELLPGYRVGQGRDRCECGWYVQENGQPCLIIEGVREGGRLGPICMLSRHADGIWRGLWLQYEKMPVELVPIGMKDGFPQAACRHVARIVGHGDAETRRRIGMSVEGAEPRPGYAPPDRAVLIYDRLWDAVRIAPKGGDSPRLALAVRRLSAAYEDHRVFRERLQKELSWLSC